jgi:hypothetical protein
MAQLQRFCAPSRSETITAQSYVGKSNMTDLEETQHESFPLPTNKDIRIWRYMDLAKYLSMLDRRSLFFARATMLGDPFEGSSTKKVISARDFIKANRVMDPRLAAYKDMPDAFFDSWSKMHEWLVRTYLVSCWHMNDHESAAMWKIYSSSNESVCIQSTYQRLRCRLPQHVKIGEVRYIDYETDEFSVANGFNFIMHKRLSFVHERELRAIFWQQDGTSAAQADKERIGPNGLQLEVDLAALIERVYVSPTAAGWFADVVSSMTRKCGYSFPVDQSSLAEAPLY